MQFFEYDFNIEIEDTGYNNKLSNRGFLRLMQEVACLHSNIAGCGLNDRNKTNIAWIILDWKLQVFDRPVWNSKISVRSWVREVTKISTLRDFEVFDANNNRIAIASSKWIALDAVDGSIKKLPEICQFFEVVDKAVFDTSFKTKLTEPNNCISSFNFNVQRRDIDINRHLNNIFYLDYATECLPEDVFFHTEFNNIEIMYKSSAILGDTILCKYSKVDNYYVVSIKSADNNILHAIVKMY